MDNQERMKNMERRINVLELRVKLIERGRGAARKAKADD